jgi:hypothetical protein
MRTTPDFLIQQCKDRAHPPRWTQFACYVRNLTRQALSLEIPFGALEAAPKMSAAAHVRVKMLNRQRYAATSAAAGLPAAGGVNLDAPRQAAAGPDGTIGAALRASIAPGGSDPKLATPQNDWRS